MPERATRLRGALERIPELRFGLELLWSASRRWSATLLATLVAQGLLPAAMLALLAPLTDRLAEAVADPSAPDPLSGALVHVAAMGALLVLAAILQAIATVAGEAQAEWVSDHVQERIHEQSVALDLSYFESSGYYDDLHRAQREGSFRPQRIASHLAQGARAGVVLLGVTLLLLVYAPALVAIVALLSAPGFVARLRSAETLYRWRRSNTEAERTAQMYGRMLTEAGFAKELRLFGLGPHLRGLHRELRARLRGERLAIARGRALADIATRAGAALGFVGALGFVTVRARAGALSVGEVVMIFAALQRGLTALHTILGSAAGLYEDARFLGHLRAFLELRPRQRRAPDAPPPPALTRALECRGLRFRYPGMSRDVLDGLDVEIRRGEVTALVGESGSGKSTLVKMLCRLHDPSAGSVLWDGRDLRELDADALRRRVAVVFEDFARFPATAHENIAFGDVERIGDRAAAEAAARTAGAHELVARLPDGYDTLLGKWFVRGQELSAGEWRRVALARAFFRDAELVILDEPTGGLDAFAEAELFARFADLAAGRTALVVSHRFSTVRHADRILVLAEGRIVEDGSHAELMRLDGVYARMYRVMTLARSGDQGPESR